MNEISNNESEIADESAIKIPKILSKEIRGEGWASNLVTDENISVLST